MDSPNDSEHRKHLTRILFAPLLLCLLIVYFASILAAYHIGRQTTLNKSQHISPTPTTNLKYTPTGTPRPTCIAPPSCSDIVPHGCTRGEPVYDSNGCQISCGQLQCESLQANPSPAICTKDDECPKSSSCTPFEENCWVYKCIDHKCVFVNTL